MERGRERRRDGKYKRVRERESCGFTCGGGGTALAMLMKVRSYSQELETYLHNNRRERSVTIWDKGYPFLSSFKCYLASPLRQAMKS